MKLLDRLINFIFSLVMLVLSVVVLLVLYNFIDSGYINSLIDEYVWGADTRFIVITTSCVVFLAALKTTIFLSDFKKKKKIPIVVSTGNGTVQIASETIESTAKAVALSHEEVRDVNVKMVNKNKGIEIFMSLLVVQDTNIKTITEKIQDEVKEKVNETTGVLVLNTDIKVKNIIEKNKKIKENKEIIEEKNTVQEKTIQEDIVQENTNEEIVETVENTEIVEKEENE